MTYLNIFNDKIIYAFLQCDGFTVNKIIRNSMKCCVSRSLVVNNGFASAITEHKISKRRKISKKPS